MLKIYVLQNMIVRCLNITFSTTLYCYHYRIATIVNNCTYVFVDQKEQNVLVDLPTSISEYYEELNYTCLRYKFEFGTNMYFYVFI